MTVLVTAASKHGATEEIGHEIMLGLRACGVYAEFDTLDKVATLEGYDAVVLGSAIYAGRWTAPARAFVDAHLDELRGRPLWLFTSGPVGDPPTPADESADTERIAAASHARGHRTFAGRVDRSELNLFERVVVRAVHAPEGDFRDWAAVRDWTRQIADWLKSTTADEYPASGGATTTLLEESS